MESRKHQRCHRNSGRGVELQSKDTCTGQIRELLTRQTTPPTKMTATMNLVPLEKQLQAAPLTHPLK
jgi:hypothetical protein